MKLYTSAKTSKYSSSDRVEVFKALLAIALCYLPTAALHARDLEDALTAPFEDPLQTRPKILDRGAQLPGDREPFQCSQGKQFDSPLSLSEAVDIALCNNPQVRVAWTGIKLQAAALGNAESAYLPTLSANASRMRTGTSYPDTGLPSGSVTGNTMYGSLSWRLFDFGTRSANRQSANSLLLAAMADHEASLQKTLAQTVQSYFDAQSAKASWKAKQETEATARETMESAIRREGNGVVGHGDTLQATTALAKATLEKNRSQSDYRKILASLAYSMGIPADSRIVLAEDAGPEDFRDLHVNALSGESDELDNWIRNAQKFHPAIASARVQWEAAKSNVTSARAEGLPTIDFSANNYQNGYPGQGLQPTKTHINTIGVSITIPIFDGFSQTYKIRSAQAQAEQREAQLADTEQNVSMEVVKAYADALSALQNLQASRTLLESASEALAASQRKYERGATDILEILSTQAAFADAKQERVRCLSDWRSSRLRLLAATGMLGQAAFR